MKTFDSVKHGSKKKFKVGVEGNENSPTRNAKGIRQEPAFYQYRRNHDDREGDVPGCGPDRHGGRTTRSWDGNAASGQKHRRRRRTAEENLLQFGEKWRKQYPSCVKSWEENWEVLSTFYEYSMKGFYAGIVIGIPFTAE
jgi:hypothetical protein